MEISLYFEPVNLESLGFDPETMVGRLGEQIEFLDESCQEADLSKYDAVILGVNEGRNALNNQGCNEAPDQIRKYLYQLFQGKKQLRIADLGNILAGEKINDTYFAVTSSISGLLAAGVIPIVIGGGQDLTYPVYLGYEERGRVINLACVDARFDCSLNKDLVNSQSYLSKIIFRKPSFLFNFSNIGYQTFFVGQSEITLLDRLYFDAIRLGKVRENIAETEPTIRNADFLAVDISSVRQSEAPGNGNASPNGLFGEEACQLTRYAGLSSKLSCIGFFETNPALDHRGQTAHLVAQMIWYFFEGLANRISDYPGEDKTGFIKYIVSASGHNANLVFYKSKKTDRWWMELPVSIEKEASLSRHVMVPCSYNDYRLAGNNEIPDRWWKAYQKLM
jgi:formiminoglutamase